MMLEMPTVLAITSYERLRPGDLIAFQDRSGVLLHTILPGNYSHVAMYMGEVSAPHTIRDRLTGEYLAVGTPYILHTSHSKTIRSETDDSAVDGLGYSPLNQERLQCHIAMRVSWNWKTGVQLSSAERDAVVARAIEYCENPGCYPAGPPYDLNWAVKDPTIGTPLYCSEHIWAAYITALNIDLDSNTPITGFTDLKTGVSPTDIVCSPYVSVIAANLTLNDGAVFPASNPLYLVNLRVNSATYYNDHETLGKGDMVMRLSVGDAEYPTGASFPAAHGSYIDYASGETVSAGSGETVYWYISHGAQLSAIVSSTRSIRMSVQGVEIDTFSDDPYAIATRVVAPGQYTLGVRYTKAAIDDDIEYRYSYMITQLPPL